MLNLLIPYIDGHFADFNEKYGLADITTFEKDGVTKTFPSVQVGQGESKQINFESLCSYHRLRSAKTIDYTENNTTGCSKSIRLVYPMYMIGTLKKDCQYSEDNTSNRLSNILNQIAFPKPVRSSVKAWSIELEVNQIDTNAIDIFQQEFTGVDLNVNSEYIYFSISYNIIIEADSKCLDIDCSTLPQLNCEDVVVTLENTLGEILLTQSFAPGTQPSITAPDATYRVINSIGEEQSNGSIPSGTSEDITANDAVISLINTAEQELFGVQVPSGVSQNVTVPDATAHLKKENDGTLRNVDIPAGVSTQIIIDDSVITLKNTADEDLDQYSVHAEDALTITAPDAVVRLKDTAGNILSTTNEPSGTTNDIIAPNATVNLNGSPFLTPRSGQTVAATVIDQAGQTATVITSGSQIIINNYDEVDNYLATIGSTSLPLRTALRAFKQTLLTNNLWRRVISFNPLCGGTAATNVFPMVGRNQLLLFGGITHSATGMKGNGTNGYYSMQLPFGTFKQNDASIFVYLRDNIQDNTNAFGLLDSQPVGITMTPRSTTNFINTRCQNASNNMTASTDSRRLNGVSRVNGTEYYVQQGTNQFTITQTANTPSTVISMFGMGQNSNGTITAFSTNEHACILVMEGLTLAQMTIIRGAVDTLMTFLGRNV